MAETRSVYDSIINGTLQPPNSAQRMPSPTRGLPGPSPQPPSLRPLVPVEGNGEAYQLPFSGRSAELQTLHDLTTSHKLALLEGEPGIGKTRLAQEFINTAPSGALALVGGAHELEQSLPYQPIIEALRGLLTRPEWPALQAAIRARLPAVWLAEVARLLPELDSATASQPASMPADESRLWEGLHQFLVTLAAQQPVIFFIDDLQWADSSTLALLGFLIRKGSAPIFFLAGTRPVPPRSPLASLLQTLTREDRLIRLSLSRLDAAHITAIAHNLCTHAQHREVLSDWLIRSSEGNPYVLAELVRHARDSGLISADGQVNLDALSGSPIVPQSIYTLIQARLSRLSEPARRVLDAAVAVGREFEFEVVYRAAGLSESAALDALDELQAAALIRPRDRTTEATGNQLLYTFDHSLTMEVAYREVGEARHRLMHRRIAEAIETVFGPRRLDSVAGLIASHFIEGNAPDRAAPYALRAGRQAVRLAAWKEAAEFFEQALAIDLDDSQCYAVNMELGEARFRAGAFAPAAEAFRAALAAASPGTTEADRAHLDLARALFSQARFGEAIEHLRQVNDSPPAIAAQREFTWAATLSVEGADLPAASEHLRRAESHLAQSSSPGDLPLLAEIKFELGSVAAQQGELEKAVALYREALDIAEEAPGDTGVTQRILAHNNLAYHLHLLGDSAAHEYASRGLQLAQEKGEVTMQPYLLSTLGEIALAANDLDLAERYFTEGLALAEQISMPERIAGLTANLGLVARARGQNDLAIHRLSTALARADALGTRHLAALVRLWLAPLLPVAQARTYLAEVRAFAEYSGRQKLLEAVRQLEKD
jgi:tetratricopeptide (TPR) repeat protein